MGALGMLGVDVRVEVMMVEPDQGRVGLFVNYLDCGYYMFLKPEIISIF